MTVGISPTRRTACGLVYLGSPNVVMWSQSQDWQRLRCSSCGWDTTFRNGCVVGVR